MEEIYFVDNEIQNYVNKLKVKTLFINSDQKNKDLFNQINKEINQYHFYLSMNFIAIKHLLKIGK